MRRPRIILASTSASRKALLAAAGVPFEAVAPAVDEDALKARMRQAGKPVGPGMATALARAKAVSVSNRHEDALVIGADQILVCDGEAFDKPSSITEARIQLERLRGQTHRLLTSVAVAERARVIWSAKVQSRLTMRTFSDPFLSSYLRSEGKSVTESVGAYRLEGRGLQLFSAVEGDYFSILGLPLLRLLEYLRSRGALPE